MPRLIGVSLIALLPVVVFDGWAYSCGCTQVLNRLIISGLGLKALPWEVITVTPVGNSIEISRKSKTSFPP